MARRASAGDMVEVSRADGGSFWPMCGRYVAASPPDEIARYFDVAQVGEAVLEPSYNVAPTNDVYVVLETGGVRRLETMRWGLVPFWA